MLKEVFPKHMALRYDRLESLKIVHCNKLQVIFDLQGIAESVKYESCLKVLQIQHLEELQFVWKIDPNKCDNLNFKRLHNIEVIKCDELKYLFPVSIAKDLQQLDSLTVFDCACIQVIVGNPWNDESSQNGIPFKFLKLTYMAMDYLPELKSFCKGRYSLEWPNLKKLSVKCCDNLEALRIKLQGDSIFLPEEMISNLEYMAISEDEAKRLLNHFKSYRMNHMKEFALVSCSSADILYQFLNRMPCVERLTLHDCDMEELSVNLETQENIGTIVQLKSLRLHYLTYLKDIGFEIDLVLQCLENLNIIECHTLINLAPSSVTLSHLTSLEVRKCRGLESLMGFSTAKSMVQLISLKVIECESLEEIVA